MENTARLSSATHWWNLVCFARRHDIGVIRVTAVQHRHLRQLPWDLPVHPYTPAHAGTPAKVFGHPIEEVPEGLDLSSAVERASLGEPRITREGES